MQIALVAFDRMTSLDFIGFYDPVTRLKSMKIMDDFNWRICSTADYVVDDRGLRIDVGAKTESLDFCDILFVPGGFGTRNLQHDSQFINWLKTARSVQLKTSVCTGALLLGAAGFLQGHRATTHPTAYEELKPYCDKVVQKRIVDDKDIITAGGVSASIDLGLYLVEKLAGREARRRIATQMDYLDN